MALLLSCSKLLEAVSGVRSTASRIFSIRLSGFNAIVQAD